MSNEYKEMNNLAFTVFHPDEGVLLEKFGTGLNRAVIPIASASHS